MNILIVASYYIPDGGPAGQLYKLLCESLIRRGHHVTVLTSVPHYPTGYVPQIYKGKLICKTVENGVNIIRVSLPSLNRRNLLFRMIQFLCFQINVIIAGFWLKYDVVLAHSPAIECFLPFVYFSIIRKKPAIYSIHDVYPDVGIKLGIFRNRTIIEIVAMLERFCIKNSKKVRILSSSFLPGLKKLIESQEKIVLIYDWVDINKIRPISKINEFSKKYELENSFVITYAGNIGLVQGLEALLDAAEILISENEIVFAFIGDGSNRKSLMEKTKNLNLINVRFIPYQPIELMSEVYSSADIALVSLSKGTGYGALPSKTYSIMASGRPIIACLDQGSEASELIQRSGAGISIPPEDPVALANCIQMLKNDKELREKFGRNGREYVVKYHSPESAAEKFEKLFLDML